MERKIKKVLIIGAGTMGWQLAQIFAQNRFEVCLSDISDEQLEHAQQQGRKNLEGRVAKGKLNPEKKDRIIQAITYTKEWANVIADIDLVIEAVPEKLDLKRKIFAQLAEKVAEGTICGSNSSTIAISKIVEGLPKKFTDYACNIHFSNPPLRLHLVELYSFSKNEDLLKFLKRTFRKMQYDPVILQEPVSGFLMNRILGAAMIETFNLLEQKVATPEDIDTACTAGLNWPLGICRICDLVGLDIVLNSIEAVYEETKMDYMKPNPLLLNLVKKNKLGWKTGEGIYRYRPLPENGG
jgi:3-hydroxybutyryl-CoA dehydrogenase